MCKICSSRIVDCAYIAHQDHISRYLVLRWCHYKLITLCSYVFQLLALLQFVYVWVSFLNLFSCLLLQHTVKNGSNVNITLFIENLPTNLSTIRSEKSSIDFYWNKNDFDENHTPLVTQEDVQVIRQELDVALSKINHPSYSYVDINVNGRTNME